ncbi:MAG: cytochrome P450 [Pseudomonadales bacterium]
MTEVVQSIPVYEGNVFSEENLHDSRQMFKELRDLGRLVWVPSLNVYVVARYEDVKAGLRANGTLISGEGVSMNPVTNSAAGEQASTLISDGDNHLRLKKILMQPLSPAAIQDLKDRLSQLAEERIPHLTDGNTFDAMKEVASLLPLNVVAEQVGIQNFGYEKMLAWSDAIFNAWGPAQSGEADPERMNAIQEFLQFLLGQDRENLIPGGWGDKLFLAVDDGKLSEFEAQSLLGDYIVPSLDTTIYSMGQMLYGLATSPGAWDKFVANPELSKNIVLESVRMATALRGFTRYAAEDYTVGDFVVPQGARVWLLNGAANRDERKYPNPDTFDVDRKPVDQLAWGHGMHLCVGKHLAQLEMETILNALHKHVGVIELAGEPTRIANTLAQGFETLPMRFRSK